MQTSKSYLEARGILPATIRAHALEFDAAPSAERIIARLGEDIQIAGQPLSAYAKELLWVPYLNADGAITSWTARILPTPADPYPKFLTPKAGGGPPYIPPAVWKIADKPNVPIILTEGPVKALACIQVGHPAIGLNGVYGTGSRDAEDKIVLHPLLSSFDWPKRFVLLAFDADIMTKFDVRKALFRTFLLLAAQQADVFTITCWDVEEAKGVDDFLAKSENPAQELELLVKDAAPFVSILEKITADLRLAEEELKAIMLPRLQRAQIVRQVAKAVGVTAKDLLAAVSPPEVEPGRDRVLKLIDETAPWDGLVDGEELIMDIYKTSAEIVWLSKPARMTCAFWLLASFVFTLFRKFPYLRIKSADRNCGKSTLVDVLNEFVWNPILAVDVSPAALYRVAEEFQPTILLDEFDNPEQIRELTQLLNAGYDANRVAVRQNNDKGALEGFRTFCPKVIASIKRLHETTESRCLPIDMQRVPPDEEKELVELCDVDPAKFLAIKRKILAWVEDHLEQIKRTRPERPDWLKTRDWDLWRPLFTIAEVIGGNAPDWIQTAARELFEGRVVEQSLAIEILSHIRDAAREPSLVLEVEKDGKSGRFLKSTDIVDYCNGDLEAPWANWKSGDSKGLTRERLAKELRVHFKTKADQVTHQKHRIRGYWLKPLDELFSSFLRPEDEPSGGPSPQTEGSEGSSAVTGTEDEEKGNSQESPKNTHGLVRDHASASHTGIFSAQVGETNLCAAQVQNDYLCAETDYASTTCEFAHKSKSEIFPPTENLFLAIDVETSATLQANAKVSPDALDPHKAELWVVSAATPDGNVIIHDFRKGPLPDYLRAAIATIPLIAHGAAFDLAVLQANGYATSKDIFCTLTASRLLTAGLRDSNDLGAVLRRHLGLEIPKELSSSDFGGMFLTDDQLEYCRNDVTHLHRLREALQAKLVNPADEHGDGAEGVDLVRIGELEMALIPLMVDIRLRGIQVDRPRLEQILSTYEARTKQLAAELRTQLQAPKLNFAAPDQLLSTLKGLGLNLSDTSKDTLSAVVDPVAGQLLRYREIAGLCQTMNGWLEALDSNNRLYPPLNPLGAQTGRFSCPKPNLLAVPRNSEVRGCFIPHDPEHVLIEADYANIEMRIAAWFAQEPRMLEVFRNGGDIHGETAERILRDRQARQPAKPVNFGCLYGGGAERLRITARTEFGIEFSQEQAKQYHDQFFNAYGNLRRWHEAARDSGAKLTYGASVFGRRRWADPADRPDHWDWNRFQLATNYEVQATGADALKIALHRLYSQTAGSETRILLPVHDSILVQTPQHHAQKVAKIVCETMRAAFLELLGKDFPVAVDYKISQRWGQGK